MIANVTGMVTAETDLAVLPPRDSDRDRTYSLRIGDNLHLFGSGAEFARLRDVLSAALDAEGPTTP